jgi:hypothetical protein
MVGWGRGGSFLGREVNLVMHMHIADRREAEVIKRGFEMMQLYGDRLAFEA